MKRQNNFFVNFMKLAGPYWTSKRRVRIWTDTVLLVVLTVMQIKLAVYITQWSAGLFDAIDQRSTAGIKTLTGVLILIFIGSMAVTTLHLVVKRRLMIGWRAWLTEKVMGAWLQHRRQLQSSLLPPDEHDNPDGRIAEDIRIATEDAITLCHSMFYCLMLLINFAEILWGISGKVVFEFGQLAVPVTGYLVWISISYSICASMLGWWMGKPMTSATHARQTQEANFRHNLIDIHNDTSNTAAEYAEIIEQERLQASFHSVVKSFAQETAAWVRIQLFSSGYSVVSMALPILVASPRYIAGSITLGMLIQSAQSFQHMVSALSWPVDNMPLIAKWRTSVERVLGLMEDTLEVSKIEATEMDSV